MIDKSKQDSMSVTEMTKLAEASASPVPRTQGGITSKKIAGSSPADAGGLTPERINWIARNCYGSSATEQEIEFARAIEREVLATKAAQEPPSLPNQALALVNLLQRWASWIVRERPKNLLDHACARCVPHSDMLVDGFNCVYHEALDTIGGLIPLAAPSAKQEPALVPKWVGEFSSHGDWVNRAQRVLSVPSHKPPAVCVDAKGRRCFIGADMARARDEGAFPVRYFWECELAAPSASASPAAPDVQVAGSQQVPEEVGGVNLARLLRNLEETSYNEGSIDLACRCSDSLTVIKGLLAAAPAVPVPVEQDEQARDAARYRWLRHMVWDSTCFRNEGHMKIGEELDAAVDAAMAAPSLQQPKEGAES